MHDFSFLLLQLHNKWFKIKNIFESRTVDTVHVPLSPYRMLFLTNILYITCHILSGLLIPYSNCTPRFIESSMSPGLGISIHTIPYLRFLSFHILCAGPALYCNCCFLDVLFRFRPVGACSLYSAATEKILCGDIQSAGYRF